MIFFELRVVNVRKYRFQWDNEIMEDELIANELLEEMKNIY